MHANQTSHICRWQRKHAVSVAVTRPSRPMTRIRQSTHTHTPQTQPHHTRVALHPLQSQPCMRRLFVHLETYQRRGLNISLNMQMLVYTKKRRPRNVQTSAALTGCRKLFYPSQRKQSQRLDSNTGFNQSCGERKLPLNRLRCFTCLSSQNLELQKENAGVLACS